MPLLAIDSGVGGFYVMRGAGFYFDEAEYVFFVFAPVPTDQIDLSAIPRRAKIAREPSHSLAVAGRGRRPLHRDGRCVDERESCLLQTSWR